jgi:hypothetical protein
MISREQFEIELDNAEQVILGFLTDNYESSFEILEVGQEVFYRPNGLLERIAVALTVMNSLQDLESKGLVQHKCIRGTDYYCAKYRTK